MTTQTPMLPIQNYRLRLQGVFLIFSFFSSALVYRGVSIQAIGDQKLAQLSQRQFQSKIQSKNRRGLIVDRNQEPLAINIETSSLAGNPSKFLKSRATLLLMSRALNIPVPVLKKKYDSQKTFVWIERSVREQREAHFKKTGLIQPDQSLPEGLWIVKEMQRIYPHGSLAGSVLGNVNIDNEGIEGIELWKNDTLKGKSKTVDGVRDALGRTVSLGTKISEQQDGGTIELAIDASLQYAVEQEVKFSRERLRAEQALAIVLDADTGEILALAHSDESRHKLKPVTDTYEPGSTIKPLLVATALEAGYKINSRIYGGNGKIVIQGKTISEAESHEKFSEITLEKLLEVSSNCASANLALKLGSEKFISSLKAFGLGTKPGSAFPGEISGWLPDVKKRIQPLTLATMGFGQGFTATPLQIARAYASFVNGGFLVQPTFFKVDESFAKNQRIPLLKKSTTEAITQALLNVTEGQHGTGKKAKIPGFRIAGKTGTAQTVDPKTKRYSTVRYISSFAGYVVHPRAKYVALTWVDYPKGIYYASETAVPLFQSVMKATLNRFTVPATEKIPEPLSPLMEQKLSVVPSHSETPPQDATPPPVILQTGSAHLFPDTSGSMPAVVGLSASEALVLLNRAPSQVKISGHGWIQSQSPSPGSALNSDTEIKLELKR